MTPTQPGKLFWLAVLAAFWALCGLTGRDAWQAEEANTLATVLEQLSDTSSFWAAPSPLFTWVASLFAHWAPFGLDLQNSARLASGAFTLSALLGIALAARSLLGQGFGPAAVLALMGGFGLMLRAHALIPETALLAVWALLLWGMAWSRARPKAGGMFLGLCLATLTLGLRGLPDLAAGLALLVLPLAFRSWSTAHYRLALALALSLGGALILAGMASLTALGQLDAWLQWHGPQRLLPTMDTEKILSQLAWFAWPLWPLALAAVWHDHRRLARTPELHLPLLALIVFLLAAQAPAWSRMGSLLPVLLPLALLAAQALAHLRRGAAQAFYWFGVLCFLFFGIAFWVYFSAIEWGFPAKLAAHVAKLTPSYLPGSVSKGEIGFAVAATLLWLLAIPLFPRAQSRPVLVWATGMILVWVLLAALFRPWAEAGWGYRPLLTDMAHTLPAGVCLNTDEVDPAMQTMVHYYLGDHLRAADAAACPWRMRLVTRSEEELPTLAGYALVWEGYRPRYKNQVYRLEHRREP